MDEIIVLFHWFCIGTWIIQLIRLNKREDKTSFKLTLILGLVTLFTIFLVGSGLFFWILVIISLFLGRGKEEPKKNKNEEFWCGICQAKYREEFLGCETITEGKICRYCLEKKHSEKK